MDQKAHNKKKLKKIWAGWDKKSKKPNGLNVLDPRPGKKAKK